VIVFFENVSIKKKKVTVVLGVPCTPGVRWKFGVYALFMFSCFMGTFHRNYVF